jgi:hypothetical protein
VVKLASARQALKDSEADTQARESQLANLASEHTAATDKLSRELAQAQQASTHVASNLAASIVQLLGPAPPPARATAQQRRVAARAVQQPNALAPATPPQPAHPAAQPARVQCLTCGWKYVPTRKAKCKCKPSQQPAAGAPPLQPPTASIAAPPLAVAPHAPPRVSKALEAPRQQGPTCGATKGAKDAVSASRATHKEARPPAR